MTVHDDQRHRIEVRACHRCEYCGMHQALQGATFPIEHVVPVCRGGQTTLENLALACPGCNLRKADRVQFPDPETGEFVQLFNPRTDEWAEHFRWGEFRLLPITAVGRTTIAALNLNHPRRLRIREAELQFDLFPP